MKKQLIIPLILVLGIIFLATSFSSSGDEPVLEKTEVPKGHPKIASSINPFTVAEEDLIFPNPENNNCVDCHSGVEPIRDPKSGMMQAIYHKAIDAGYPDNECIVCHGGNPWTEDPVVAHSGSIDWLKEHKGPDEFYPDPASVWINDKTCGMCHEEQVSTQFTSLMFTEAGKIQGTTWGFGGLQGYEHNVANVAVEELKVHERLGSDTYKSYMAELKAAEPQVFPGKMKELPPAPTAEQIELNPELAAYSYLRTECQRCHTGVKGHDALGDFRGTGCGSCHIPYSNKGLYEGDDPTIDKKEAGHMLVHSIQSSRDATVKVHDTEYTGIPTKTCTSCHNRGRRIGVSYEGLMESSYQSPFMSNGDKQEKIHKKNYIHLQSDIHLKKGMVCQDCHTSGDMHSLGDLAGTIAGAVEIECQDCHGTPTAYPWDLPIGYGDEIAGTAPKTGEARGVSPDVEEYLKRGYVPEPKDGYLISSRGNAMPRVVKDGDEIILHSSSGKDIPLKPLKLLTDNDELSLEGKVAMTQVNSHIDKMECFACHATWAPQCYGCHINIDYSDLKLKTDWVEVAKSANEHGQTADMISDEEVQKIQKLVQQGEISEQRSYLRWEDPPLVVNGEHRISPAIPGCQTTVTVKNKKGEVKLLNHIFKVPHAEGAGEEGQLGIDMSPLQPHTIQAESRSCESCHNNPKSMGYGIEEGKLYADPSKDVVMDLTTIDGQPLAEQVDTQFNAIPNLKMDWSRFVDEEGRQLQTVGHHFSGSRPLNKEELSKLDRRGVCMSCHESVPDQSVAINLLSHVAEYGGVEIDNDKHNSILNNAIHYSAYFQILMVMLALVLVFLLYKRFKAKKKK